MTVIYITALLPIVGTFEDISSWILTILGLNLTIAYYIWNSLIQTIHSNQPQQTKLAAFNSETQQSIKTAIS